jgi:hypothetical protein
LVLDFEGYCEGFGVADCGEVDGGEAYFVAFGIGFRGLLMSFLGNAELTVL